MVRVKEEVKQNLDAWIKHIGFQMHQSELRSFVKNYNKIPRQHGGTCYANAVAAVICLATRRIVGRKMRGIEREGMVECRWDSEKWGHYPDFDSLREQIIKKYGEIGANTGDVLDDFCETFGLQTKIVTEELARHAISKLLRPSVATFSLTESQWKKFGAFFENNPKGVLETVGDPLEDEETHPDGHTVTLIDVEADGTLKFMNSWGEKWGDNGFFRVKSGEVLSMVFHDVFWTECEDLCEEERYVAQQMFDMRGINHFVDLGLAEFGQKLRFTCPACDRRSPICFYGGNLEEAFCLLCWTPCKPREMGLLLFLLFLV
eukprot:TRINITY_DN24635_c0_g2_i1.p1 TRINITY_DN24635_c0_g2~~TRINITY_DN24635_c0_g2_i1.p1  ORF type:complete len:318 (+),score=68.17 TRINITY_DN24635_c0_g2_i1:104-1057(+)